MRALLRSLFTIGISLYLVTRILSGVSFSRGFTGLSFTLILLVLINTLVKPILNLLLLPLNLITLGTFRWISQVLVLYLASLLSPDLTITSSRLGQFSLGPFWTLIAASFLLNLFQVTLRWFLR